jgi:hypothetical protein
MMQGQQIRWYSKPWAVGIRAAQSTKEMAKSLKDKKKGRSDYRETT